MAWIRCVNGSAISSPSKVKTMFLTDFKALSTKDSDTLYNVLNDNTNRICGVFVGDTVMSVYDPTEYDYTVLNIYGTGSAMTDNNTGIQLFSSANIDRDWEMEFSCSPTSVSGDKSVVGIGSGDTHRMYVEYGSGGNLQVGMPTMSISISVSFQEGDIFKVVRDGSDLSVYKNGTLQSTRTYNPTQSQVNNYYLLLGQYGNLNQDYMRGFINFFTFKFND